MSDAHAINQTAEPMPAPTASAARPPAEPPLGRAAIRGSLWMLVGTIVTKSGSLVAQVVLAWFLSDRDFGVYFIALSLSVLAAALRDGGVRQILIQDYASYERMLGPVFWLGGVMNVAAAVLLSAMAPLAARVYGEPQITPILLIIAVSIPLGTPAALLSVRLHTELRFRELAWISAWSALARFGGSIALAALGLGPMSLVLPLPLIAVIEWAMLVRMNRDRLWSRACEPRLWGALFGRAKWVMLGTFATGVWNMGNYFLVGLIVPAAVVGVYAWSNQLVMQIGFFMWANVNQVLFPAFARLGAEPERKRHAVLRAMRTVLFFAAPACALLGPLFPSIEAFLWQGKWAGATTSVRVIAALYAPTCLLPVSLAVQHARGEFRAWALMVLGMALAMMAAGGAGAMISGTPAGIAAWSGVAMGLVCFVHAIVVLRPLRIGWTHVLSAVIGPSLVALAASAAAMGADHALREEQPVLRGIAVGACFAVTFGALARVFLPVQVRESVAVFPAAARASIRRVLFLPRERTP